MWFLSSCILSLGFVLRGSGYSGSSSAGVCQASLVKRVGRGKLGVCCKGMLIHRPYNLSSTKKGTEGDRKRL